MLTNSTFVATKGKNPSPIGEWKRMSRPFHCYLSVVLKVSSFVYKLFNVSQLPCVMCRIQSVEEHVLVSCHMFTSYK